jgi:hypothetical protein
MNRSTLISFVGGLLLGAAALQAGTIQYQVTVDTSGFAANTPGFIDFQFNQADVNALSGTLSINTFYSTGYTFNDGMNAFSSGVTGSFTSLPVVIRNDAGGTNYFARGVNAFGSSFTAILTISGNVVGGTATDPSKVFVILEDSTGAPLFSSGDIGEVGSINFNTDGTSTPTVYAFAGGSASIGAPTPEPSTVFAGLLGLVAVAARHRRRA